MPKISVVIPAYNSAKYIAEALDSVLAQTYPVSEIIVVDDGSTDNTAEVVKKYGIKYIYQENKGPAAARNTGIKASAGDYIAFLDSDDSWLPEKIEKQVNKLKDNTDISLVHTNRIRITDNGKVELTQQRNIPEGQVFNELIRNNYISCSSVIVKKSCFDEVGLFDEDMNITRCEDYDMWLRLAYRYEFGHLNEELVKYRVSQNGYIRGDIKAAYDAKEAVFRKALNYYQGDKERLQREVLQNSSYSKGRSFLYIHNYEQSASAFFEALRYKKTDLRAAVFYLFSKLLAFYKKAKICQSD